MEVAGAVARAELEKSLGARFQQRTREERTSGDISGAEWRS